MNEPLFCTKCEEIRGVDNTKRTLMTSPYETLCWKSFGMCSHCNAFLQNFPEEVKKNKLKKQQKIEAENIKVKEKIEAKKYRIYVNRGINSFSGSDFLKNCCGVNFWKYGITNNNIETVKSKELFSKEEAILIVEKLKQYNVTSWYE